MQIIQAQVNAYPSYSLTFTGHGTGGAVASVAAVQCYASLGSGVTVQVMTYGAPRVGNSIWAEYTESILNGNDNARYVRVTHGDDNVPQLLSVADGYQHAAVEIYFAGDQTSSSGMYECLGSEDYECNAGTVEATSPSLTSYPSTQTSHSSSAGSTTVWSPFQSTSTADDGGLSSSTSSTSDSDSGSSGSASALTSQGSVSCSTCTGTDCILCTTKLANSTVVRVAASTEAGEGVSGNLNSTVTTNDAAFGSAQASSNFTEALETLSPASNLSSSLSSVSDAYTVPANLSVTTESNRTSITARQIFEGTEKDVKNVHSKQKRTSVTVDSAHLTYLGIAMDENDSQLCAAASTSSAATSTSTTNQVTAIRAIFISGGSTRYQIGLLAWLGLCICHLL